jgi:hypothetical protein
MEKESDGVVDPTKIKRRIKFCQKNILFFF